MPWSFLHLDIVFALHRSNVRGVWDCAGRERYGGSNHLQHNIPEDTGHVGRPPILVGNYPRLYSTGYAMVSTPVDMKVKD